MSNIISNEEQKTYNSAELERIIGKDRVTCIRILKYLKIPEKEFKITKDSEVEVSHRKFFFTEKHIQLIQNFLKEHPDTRKFFSEQTCLARYGVNNPFKTKEAQEKYKQTCLARYGVEHYGQTQECREKIKETCLKRYGVEASFQSEKTKEKARQTCLKKYGVENYSQTQESKDRHKQTCLKKYGTDNVLKSEWLKNYLLEKYGVDNRNLIGKDPHSIEIFKDKDLLQKYFLEHPDMSLREIAESLGFSAYATARKLHEYGLSDLLEFSSGTSNLELSIFNYISSILPAGTSIRRHDRTVCYPQEIDIYIPEKKIAIEVNGNYWHSELSLLSRVDMNEKKVRDYHLAKSLRCKEQGIRLIHIFEYEWENNKEKLKAFLKDILTEPEVKIMARKCEVREITSAEGRSFFDQYHLQGKDNSKVYLGLYYQGEMISCMSFSKPRFTRKYDWELMRYVSKSNTIVIGGASKLLHHFLKNYTGSIITYSDISKMSGNLYPKIGFTQAGTSSPGYVWMRGNEVLSRCELLLS